LSGAGGKGKYSIGGEAGIIRESGSQKNNLEQGREAGMWDKLGWE
jgi:hypothetical protein